MRVTIYGNKRYADFTLGKLLEHDRSARTIAISQEVFIDLILARFDLLDVSTVTTRPCACVMGW